MKKEEIERKKKEEIKGMKKSQRFGD